jgi:hypothetical protein
MMLNIVNTPYTSRFDFEIGYLVKSPCRGCESRSNLPRCSRECDLIERIQSVLAESVSCAHRG